MRADSRSLRSSVRWMESSSAETGEKGTVDSRPFSFAFDSLVVEAVRRRLFEMALSERITSNEAQWLARGAMILEALEGELRRANGG
jgi:hypothetical protein